MVAYKLNWVYAEGSSIFGRLTTAAEEGGMERLLHKSIVLQHVTVNTVNIGRLALHDE